MVVKIRRNPKHDDASSLTSSRPSLNGTKQQVGEGFDAATNSSSLKDGASSAADKSIEDRSEKKTVFFRLRNSHESREDVDRTENVPGRMDNDVEDLESYADSSCSLPMQDTYSKVSGLVKEVEQMTLNDIMNKSIEGIQSMLLAPWNDPPEEETLQNEAKKLDAPEISSQQKWSSGTQVRSKEAAKVQITPEMTAIEEVTEPAQKAKRLRLLPKLPSKAKKTGSGKSKSKDQNIDQDSVNEAEKPRATRKLRMPWVSLPNEMPEAHDEKSDAQDTATNTAEKGAINESDERSNREEVVAESKTELNDAINESDERSNREEVVPESMTELNDAINESDEQSNREEVAAESKTELNDAINESDEQSNREEVDTESKTKLNDAINESHEQSNRENVVAESKTNFSSSLYASGKKLWKKTMKRVSRYTKRSGAAGTTQPSKMDSALKANAAQVMSTTALFDELDQKLDDERALPADMNLGPWDSLCGNIVMPGDESMGKPALESCGLPSLPEAEKLRKVALEFHDNSLEIIQVLSQNWIAPYMTSPSKLLGEKEHSLEEHCADKEEEDLDGEKELGGNQLQEYCNACPVQEGVDTTSQKSRKSLGKSLRALKNLVQSNFYKTLDDEIPQMIHVSIVPEAGSQENDTASLLQSHDQVPPTAESQDKAAGLETIDSFPPPAEFRNFSHSRYGTRSVSRCRSKSAQRGRSASAERMRSASVERMRSASVERMRSASVERASRVSVSVQNQSVPIPSPNFELLEKSVVGKSHQNNREETGLEAIDSFPPPAEFRNFSHSRYGTQSVSRFRSKSAQKGRSVSAERMRSASVERVRRVSVERGVSFRPEAIYDATLSPNYKLFEKTTERVLLNENQPEEAGMLEIVGSFPPPTDKRNFANSRTGTRTAGRLRSPPVPSQMTEIEAKPVESSTENIASPETSDMKPRSLEPIPGLSEDEDISDTVSSEDLESSIAPLEQ